MYKDIYAIKDCPCVLLTNKDGEKLEIDWGNEAHLIRTEDCSAIILEVQLTSNNVDDFLKNFTTSLGEINLKFKAKSYDTGEYVVIEKDFTNMNFVKEVVSYSYDEPSGFIWVFCDAYSYMKDEIENYIKIILERSQESEVDFRLKSISENIEKVNGVFEGLTYVLKDIEKAISKQSMREETIIKSKFVNDLIQDRLDSIARELKKEMKN